MSLIPASCSTFSRRWIARVRSSVSRRPCRVTIPQQPNIAWRHETRRHQSVLDQLGDPHRVRDIGLAARHVPQMLGVDHPDREMVLQHVVDRFPIDAGRFHPDQRHLLRGQPFRERFELPGHRGERPGLRPAHTTRPRTAHRGHHRVAVHIQARRTARSTHPSPHPFPSTAGAARSGEPVDQETEVRARSSRSECLRLPASHFFTGSRHQEAPTSGPDDRADSHPVTSAGASRHDHFFQEFVFHLEFPNQSLGLA